MPAQHPGRRFSHIGLFALDIDRQACFYQGWPDFTETDRGLLDGPDRPARRVCLSHDPEGNRVELDVDTRWYVSQPGRVAAPFDRPEEAPMAWTEAHARTLPGFRPRSAWRQEMAARMGAAP